MRSTSLLVLLCLSGGAVADAQGLSLYGSAGPTITDRGYSVAAGLGFSPHSRLTLVFDVERTHLPTRVQRDGPLFSYFRGGTLLLGTAELRVVPFRNDRIGPYGVVGVAGGRSRPNVNEFFPSRVTNGVGAMFLGGGVHVPLGGRITVFGDIRMLAGAEGREGVVAVAPARVGMAWRF